MSTTEPQPKTSKQPVIKDIPIYKIRIDGDTQPRVDLDQDLIAEYADCYKRGVSLPPVDVFYDGAEYWLADGFHRRYGAVKAKSEGANIRCVIHNGTLAAARWFSYAANKSHGLRRNTADKRKAVRQALQHGKSAKMSNNQLAKYLGVDEKTVRNYREKMEAASDIPKVTEREGADGKVYDTSKIGKGKKAKSAGIEIRFPALKDLPPEQRQAAYDRAVEVAGSTPSNVHVRRVVDEFLAVPVEPGDVHPPCPTCGCTTREQDDLGTCCAKCKDPCTPLKAKGKGNEQSNTVQVIRQPAAKQEPKTVQVIRHAADEQLHLYAGDVEPEPEPEKPAVDEGEPPTRTQLQAFDTMFIKVISLRAEYAREVHAIDDAHPIARLWKTYQEAEHALMAAVRKAVDEKAEA